MSAKPTWTRAQTQRLIALRSQGDLNTADMARILGKPYTSVRAKLGSLSANATDRGFESPDRRPDDDRKHLRAVISAGGFRWKVGQKPAFAASRKSAGSGQ